MTVHFFTKGDERVGDSRQRGFRVADELSVRGIRCVMHTPTILELANTPWPLKFRLLVSLVRTLGEVKKGDLVFLQRTVGNKYFFLIMVLYLSVFRRKMIFDFDDAVYLYDSVQTKTLTRMADAVIVCSQALATWCRNYNANTHIIHTTLKLADYEPFTKDYSSEVSPVTLGWVGTARNHHENLAILSRVFRKLVGTTKVPFRFVLVGVEKGDTKVGELFESIPGLEVALEEYRTAIGIAEVIQRFDIGVNPLEGKSEWNLARSSFKPYEYMACGVAQITSAVGEITNVVHNGQNGLLADSDEEWVVQLRSLIEDRELRARLGRAGQETVRTQEAYEVVIPRLVGIIEDIQKI